MNSAEGKRNTLGDLLQTLIKLVTYAMSLFHCYTAVFGLMVPITQRTIHLCFACTLVALTYPIKLQNKRLSQVITAFFALCTIAIGLYTILRADPANIAKIAVQGPSNLDLAIGVIMILLVLEATRRVTGWALPVLGTLFILYAMFGGDLPGILGHKGYSWRTIVDQLIYSQEGVFGTPLGVSATFVALFVLFGAFLESSGAGKWFIDVAYALTGTYRSGPALTAIVSSATMGTISGTGVANVMTTGTFTIPLMKSCGYKPDYAGAVEATASTGGQIMPPVMGAAAFVLAEMLGAPYATVAIAAIIPALLYYVACGTQVHLEACKEGLKGLPKEQLPPLGPTWWSGFVYLIPLAVLIWALVIKFYTPTLSAVYGIVTVLAVAILLKKKGQRMNIYSILKALENGARGMVPVAMACATAGIMIGVVLRTGLAMKFTSLLINLSGGSLFPALLMTAVTCVILGMGLPTTASYIITATLGAPALIKIGVMPLAAHLFVFYFAALSAITPPVALAAYAGAGIAKGNPLKTGLQATKLGIAGFVVPFMFVYGPSLLMVGSAGKILTTTATALIGVILLAASVEGYLYSGLKWYERLMLLAAALCLVKPGLSTDGVGLALGLVAILLSRFHAKKEAGWHSKAVSKAQNGSI